MRGGEKCLEAIGELYPSADIYTLFYEASMVSEAIRRHPIHVSWLQRLPAVRRYYRRLLPLFPAAVRSFRVGETRLLLSTSHCVAKGIRKPAGALHVCYCFTPVRYAWGFFDEYFQGEGRLTKPLVRAFLSFLKSWDRKTSREVDYLIAISSHVQARIRDFYGREAEVIYPPVDTDFYAPDPAVAREDFYLLVSALVPYKRADIAVAAFSTLNRPLVVIGDGPERKRLEASAAPSVRFLGWQEDRVLRDYYRRAKALVFPGEEDFGIVPVEAQACGCPVIAYEKGGALETVNGATGEFFEPLTAGALASAIRRFEEKKFDCMKMRENSLRFGRERFKSEIKRFVERVSA